MLKCHLEFMISSRAQKSAFYILRFIKIIVYIRVLNKFSIFFNIFVYQYLNFLSLRQYCTIMKRKCKVIYILVWWLRVTLCNMDNILCVLIVHKKLRIKRMTYVLFINKNMKNIQLLVSLLIFFLFLYYAYIIFYV